MADGFSLDDELMMVAGRSTAPSSSAGRKKAKSRRKARTVSSDDEGESSGKEEEEEEEEGEGGDEEPKKGAAMPLKKRVAMAGAGGSDSDDDHVLEDGYAEDLMGDEEDRKTLAAMTELDREMILADRAEKRDELMERKEKVRELKERQRQEEELQKRSSSRDTKSRAAAKKDTAMRELKALRDKKEMEKKKKEKQERKRRRASDVSDDDDYGSGEGEDDEGEDDDDEDDDEDDDDRTGEDYEGKKGGVSGDEDEEEDEEEEEEEGSFEDVLAICVRRFTLEKWVDEPFFETTVPGCMVRVAVGNNDSGVPVYMLAEVVEVVEKGEDRAYKFGPQPDGAKSARKTVKFLKVKRGTSERDVKMELVSSQRPVQKEFDRWVQVLRGASMRVPPKAHLQEVRKALLDAESYQYTHEDIARMVEMKRRQKGGLLRSMAYEKDRLISIKETAEQLEREEEAQEAAVRLEELERKEMERRLNPKSKRSDLGNINDRNRDVNWKNIIRQKNWGGGGEQATEGADTLDPFSRRPTRPTTYWKVDQRSAEEGDGGGGAGGGGAAPAQLELPEQQQQQQRAEDAMAAPSPRALAATPRWGKSKAVAHDLDLDVDLGALAPSALAAGVPGGGASRLRRSAGVTRFSGGVLPPNKRTLTLNDYKRRQGLV